MYKFVSSIFIPVVRQLQAQIIYNNQMGASSQLVLIFILGVLVALTSTSVATGVFEFDYTSHMIPHPEKAHRGGEDAYFNSSSLLVVADGVGGWNSQGIDPSKYSRFLCLAAEKYMKQNSTKYTSEPLQVIVRAQEENQNIGSSTMVVVSLDGNEIKYCYIGDSGLMILRKYEKLLSIFQFVEQQHGFNFPFQLAMSKYGGDDPHQSICGQLKAKQGDIVIVGSDGFFDNYPFHQILNQVAVALEEGKLHELAQFFAQAAIERGKNPKFDSPFAQRARQQNLSYEGGKLDDTTVIIAQIRQKTEIIGQL